METDQEDERLFIAARKPKPRTTTATFSKLKVLPIDADSEYMEGGLGEEEVRGVVGGERRGKKRGGGGEEGEEKEDTNFNVRSQDSEIFLVAAAKKAVDKWSRVTVRQIPNNNNNNNATDSAFLFNVTFLTFSELMSISEVKEKVYECIQPKVKKFCHENFVEEAKPVLDLVKGNA